MRPLLRALPLGVALLLGAAGLHAQDPGVPALRVDPSFLERFREAGEAIPHPVHLALKEWDTLALTPDQVEQVRRIQEEMHDGFDLWAEPVPGDPALTSALWGAAEPDEAAVRAALYRFADRQLAMVLRLSEGQKKLRAVLTPEQGVLLGELQVAAVTRAVEAREQERARVMRCTEGSVSGSGKRSDRVALQFTAEYLGDSARIQALVIGRAERRLHGTAKLSPRPSLPENAEIRGGGNLESWYVQYDERAGVVWVDTKKVPLGDGNVVLLDRIERLHEPPVVVGTTRVPSTFFTGGCQDGRPMIEHLWDHLERIPEIRAFMEP